VLAETEGMQAFHKSASNMRLLHDPGTTYTLEPEHDAPIDFSADPEIVRTVVEGERLTYVHLFNPAFAAKISLIDPLPHQRIAVYDHMLKQTRLRFLLADDAGAGKTIMTGLYIREMLTRRLIMTWWLSTKRTSWRPTAKPTCVYVGGVSIAVRPFPTFST
jgi:hypothetical protein